MKLMKKSLAQTRSKTFFSILFIFGVLALNTAYVFADDKNDQKNDTVKNEQKDDIKDAVDQKKYDKDVKNINDRINKNKDDYTLQIKNKFLNNADKLASISLKINTRITKLDIAGEDTTDLKTKLDDADASIKKARATLRTLPSKSALLNYDDSKKYATVIVDARNNLEDAKNTLSDLVSDLKDLVIDTDKNDKN